MNLRNIRQQEFANKWLETKWGILYLCPRFGKCRTAINIFNQLDHNIKILISYPNHQIKESWENEFTETKFDRERVEYCTHLSLNKRLENLSKESILVLDEIHRLSNTQIEKLSNFSGKIKLLLGLSGTISEETEKTFGEIDIPVVARYPMEKAIEEGIISNYKITVHTVSLDNTIKNKYGKFLRTSKQQFDIYSRIIDKMDKEGRDTKFMRLNRMRLIQNDRSKIKKSLELLELFKQDRVLIFGGTKSALEELPIQSYHSSSKPEQKKLFEDFCNGETIGNDNVQFGLIQIGSTGITVKNLNKVIINYFSSNPEDLAQKINRAMAFEYNNPNKLADIHIICSNESVEKRWLTKALEFFNKEKISFI